MENFENTCNLQAKNANQLSRSSLVVPGCHVNANRGWMDLFNVIILQSGANF